MIYQGFAYIYDQLMKDAPYDQWVSFIQQAIATYSPGAKNILDVGCGTGEIAIRLANQQFHVTGVDLSEDMLAVAESKLEENKVQVLFLKQDMRDLTGFSEPFDVITICCDSLNYLESKEDILTTFRAAYHQLKNQGLLIFDVHSLYKIHHIFAGATFADQDEDVSFIWNSYLADEPNSVEHDMSFFVKQNELYKRYDELHYQRTFAIDEYKIWLEEASFEVVNICSDFDFDENPTSTSERLFFIARKIV
ncbi:class I SAM-dependent DNA methyltransferase [Metabacillus rhizolycopersici]|uniref:Class I SAM-dependent methyltransferase n=1 Tax=Metabacillus rhizolycopersici TaxID=2875709 RepID=A0ABS7ULX1_9BACI|nr:class I SAM-dependent methyltransferase [Metabacillus rhizolycopersici]MBZ5749317.1 class I SAM-dependent methyltransferase [Metabacillus rhizolycopersici]